MTVNSNENTIELWSRWFIGDNRSNDIILDIYTENGGDFRVQ